MKNVFLQMAFALIACTVIFEAEGCRKCPPYKENLSDYSKEWITYAGTEVSYSNQNSEVIFLTYSEPNDFYSRMTIGNECSDVYDLETITFSLTGSSLSDKIDFWLQGNILNTHCENSVLSLGLWIQPDTTVITHSSDSAQVREFFNQLELNGILFQNVYHAGLDSTIEYEVTDFYFNQLNGIIGFKTKDGNIWSLK